MFRALFGLLLFLAASAAHAAIFVVTETAVDAVDDNAGDGACHIASSLGGGCTLRAAIMEANVTAIADTVILHDGDAVTLSIPGLGEDAAASGDLDITAALTVRMANLDSPPNAAIDAAGLDRVFDIHGSGNVILRGLVITGGLADGAVGDVHGGGIRALGTGSLTLARCEVHHNQARQGGGLDVARTTLVEESWIHHNSAYWPTAPADAFGGGIAATVSGPTLTVVKSTVNDNTLGSAGGGIFSKTTLNIDNSTFDNNSVSAVHVENADAHLNHVTISGSVYGYVFHNNSGSHTSRMHNSIVQALVQSCDIAGSAIDVEHHFSLGHVTTTNGTEGCQLAHGNDNLPSTDPMLGSLKLRHSYLPVRTPNAASEAIDAANPLMGTIAGACLPTDQDGIGRPIDVGGGPGPLCDMGAIELEDLIFADDFDPDGVIDA